ncbi:MAG TPA: hypothetical protein VN249_09380, partial [Prolixibacteraceae bacterium]|nr:hypothetical protein [Prolixibacteraceae bacterium]
MRLLFSLVIFLIVNHAHLSAQEKAKKLYVAEKCSSVITIDGNLLENEWQGKWEGGFVQREPYENAKPSQNTEFQLLFDNDFIYVAIKALDTAPDSIVHRLSRKDKSDGDWVGIAFDS